MTEHESDDDFEACACAGHLADATSKGAYTSLSTSNASGVSGLSAKLFGARRTGRCLTTPGRRALAAGLPAVALLLVAARHLSAPPTASQTVLPTQDDGEALVVGLAGVECAGRGENCLPSQCCKEPGMACYKKVGEFGMCRPQCNAGLDPVDLSPSPWACDQVGQRTPGYVPMDYWGGLKPAAWVPKRCSEIGENCLNTGCCKDSGMTCFTKNEKWASCKPKCTPGFDITDISSDPWLCEALGNPTPGAPLPSFTNSQIAGPWTADKCTGAGGNCMNSLCCSQPGMSCFRKNEQWAGCRASCEPGPNPYDVDSSPWDCTQLGPRTPGIPPPQGPLAKWVATNCTGDDGGSCLSTMCCSGAGQQCFKKNDGWATCMHGCAPGVHAGDPDKTAWSCDKLGPRNPGSSQQPSLFCWALTMPSGEEPELIRYQLTNRLSLFQCEEWAVYSSWEIDLGGGYTATAIGDLTAKKGQWGSWLNTKVFAKAWHAILWTGQFRDHDWIVKVDPDATFFPDRLKQHVADLPSGEPWCIHNSDTETPMLGPIEVLSRGAMYVYLANNDPADSGTDKAVCENPYMGESGEDGFISGCLKRLGVKARYDPLVLKQDREDCGDGTYVAYHPCKTVEQYEKCKAQASV